jgi:GTP 3',8-cyclase
MPQPSYAIAGGRVQTRSLEVHIVDHCNLRCWGCCSLSPYLPRWCIDPSELERDLHLARGCVAPQYLKLVGGEPTLHPAIDDCLAIARRSVVAPVVSVTTNGLLLTRTSDRFWRLVQALTISLYPSPRLPDETIAWIKRRAEEHQIPVNWKRQDEFVDMDRESGPRDDVAMTQRIYDDCWLRNRCHIVSNGRFFTCTRPPHFETLHGEGAGFLNDGIMLENRPDMAERILAYLQRPDPLNACSRCHGGSAHTQPHRQMSLAETKTTAALLRG